MKSANIATLSRSKHTLVVVRGREASVAVVAEEFVRVDTASFSSAYDRCRSYPPNDLGRCRALGMHGAALRGRDCTHISGQSSTEDERKMLPCSFSVTRALL